MGVIYSGSGFVGVEIFTNFSLLGHNFGFFKNYGQTIISNILESQSRAL